MGKKNQESRRASCLEGRELYREDHAAATSIQAAAAAIHGGEATLWGLPPIPHWPAPTPSSSAWRHRRKDSGESSTFCWKDCVCVCVFVLMYFCLDCSDWLIQSGFCWNLQPNVLSSGLKFAFPCLSLTLYLFSWLTLCENVWSSQLNWWYYTCADHKVCTFLLIQWWSQFGSIYVYSLIGDLRHTEFGLCNLF